MSSPPDLPFDPVDRHSLTDRVAERLLGMIHSGGFEVGVQIPPTAELVEVFDVSPQTVRGALEKLRLMGLIDIRHGAGAYVVETRSPLVFPAGVPVGHVSRKLLVDLIDTRESIEVRAIELAALRATERDIDRLSGCLLAEVPDRADALERADAEFHAAIVEASGNVILHDMARTLLALFQEVLSSTLRAYRSRERDHEEHVGLLEAVRHREPALAAARMRSHLAGIRDAIER